VSAPTLPNGFRAARDDDFPATGEQIALGPHEELAELVRRGRVTPVPDVPYTGPVTGDQLDSLAVLEALGETQRLDDAPVPSPFLHRGVFRTGIHRVSRSAVALGLILVVQAALSLRLIWSNTAFTDEALYLWAGHLEWAHWLHGTPVPAFATYFSGSPVVYPPVGALADSIGGLAGARLLSLGFMLGATGFLYSTSVRLFGDRRAALFSAALFAGLGAAQFLGAFATYDAMALMLLAFAAWCAARGATTGAADRAVLLPACAAALALAVAAKYASALFVPVVIAIAVFAAREHRGAAAAWRSGVIVAGLAGGFATAGLIAGGATYREGLSVTTLDRAHGAFRAIDILYVSAGWAGVVMLTGVLGAVAVTATFRSRPMTALAWSLAAASFLAPAEQARIGVFTSLFKHVGYGAWFGAIAAGFALSALARTVPPRNASRALRTAASVAAAGAVSGYLLAGTHFANWPSSSRVMSALRPVLSDAHGPVLMPDAGNVAEYYLPAQTSQNALYLWYFGYTDPATGHRLTGVPAYRDAIRHRYFSVIVLYFRATDGIAADIARYGGYRVAAEPPYAVSGITGHATIWIREGA
jgi:hypothetical protein